MKKLINPVLMIAGAVALAGCGGGGTVSSAVGSAVGNGSNGLPFATETTNSGSLAAVVNGQTATVQGATDDSQASTDDRYRLVTVTIGGLTEDSIEVTVDGNTEVLDFDEGLSSYFSADYSNFVSPVLDPGTAVSAYTYVRSGIFDNEIKFDTVYLVVGNHTNPANLTGSASYAVSLEGKGTETVDNVDRRLFLDGNGTINANFATSAIDGTLVLRSRTSNAAGDPVANTARNDAFSLSGSRSGATFTAAATRIDCLTAEACVSNTSLAGNFFGQTGAEIGGIAVLDETATSSAGPVQTKGSLVFLGAQ